MPRRTRGSASSTRCTRARPPWRSRSITVRANQFYLTGDGGYPLPFAGALLKLGAHFERSVGSDTARQPDDRFGSSATNNFNKASYLKLGGSAIFPFGSKKQWAAEIGYNQWVWGRSARRYKEPFISLGRSF